MCDVRVRILKGMKEFVGKVGTIVGREDSGQMLMYRVELDHPVHIAGQGMVEDDLWSGAYLELLEYEPDEEVSPEDDGE